MTPVHPARSRHATDAILRLVIVGFALGTAYIHFTLGGLLFTVNAIGYVLGATAMVVPFAIASRFRWAVRIGLAGYAASTILGWAIQGPFFTTAYVAKVIEVGLIALLAIDFVRFDGSPITLVVRELRAGFTRLRGLAGTLGVIALTIAVVTACSGSAGAPTTVPSIDLDALRISANDLEFSTAALTAPAGETFQIVFDNLESAPHNVAIYKDESAAEEIFISEPFGGPGMETYEVPALASGEYFFRCDVHPDMKGTLTAD